MTLFKQIPDNFFAILTSKNKDIFAMSLMILFSLSGEVQIKKSEYLRTLKENLAEMLQTISLDEDPDINPNSFNRTGYILSRLEQTGWIAVISGDETGTFEEYIIIPDYAFRFLEVIASLLENKANEYNSLVYTTYTILNAEDLKPTQYQFSTLLKAEENINRLSVSLRSLFNSILLYKSRLSFTFTQNDLLANYFDGYKQNIHDRFYHPLKTFDSIVKYKRPIISILQRWLYDPSIRNVLITQSFVKGFAKDEKTASDNIITIINKICDTLDSLDRTVMTIDEKHAEYTKATTNKILSLNKDDQSIVTRIEGIIRDYAAASLGQGKTPPSRIEALMQGSIHYYESGYLGIKGSSLTFPYIRNYTETLISDEPLDSMIDFEEVALDFLESSYRTITSRDVFDFIDTFFGDQDEIYTKDISLKTKDELVMFLLAVSYNADTEGLFYDLMNVEDPKYIIHDGYKVPNFLFKRRQ
ncbi:MAG: DUF5716 family protein [Erysipelotrichaceae bacterium]|jgi:hypothetical protein|nr:DUF5716 family protein [Erysipelotrichaceae bacterium]